MAFGPFTDGSAMTLGGLTLESDGASMTVQGSMTIARDRTSLAMARALRGALDAAIADLEGRDLPERDGGGEAGGVVATADNPLR